MSIDADRSLDANASPNFSKLKKGRDQSVSAFFQPILHAVTGRLACLSVIPVLPIFKVTRPPRHFSAAKDVLKLA
jgi:hypothetical protein